ncbi:class F sortase [Nocardioides sp. HM23]|uniref:class F sortase n=1 Tax=Nocardioides bizhenqiangii TaxID=3095076 RepID=UPI002ACAEEE1|nr:class F sortase [Nocardioides sp. HM23]MDZ5621003.1 class F sortase [Nocardioides sp. HM23]
MVEDEPGGTARARVAPPAGSQVVAEPPVQLELPGGAVLAVDPVATEPGGALALPESVHRAGWWEGSAMLGDPYGAIVIAAHVDSLADGVGPIAELLDAVPGDVVRLESVGLGQAYTISRSVLVPRTDLAVERRALSFTGPRRLVLITCAGPFDQDQGGYRHNLVVVAEAHGPLERDGE